MIKLGRFTLGEKIVGIIFTLLLVRIVFSFLLAGVQRFFIMVFLAFLGVPALWYILRDEKSGDRGEIDMKPEELTRLNRDDISDYLQYVDNPYVQGKLNKLEEDKKEFSSSDEKQN